MARQVILCAATVLTAVSLAHAANQQTARAPITKTNVATATVTIEAINSTSRIITFKNDKDGTEDMVYTTPEVKRFDQLKVGDKVNIRYQESLVMQLRKPGEASTPAGDTAKATPTTGADWRDDRTSADHDRNGRRDRIRRSPPLPSRLRTVAPSRTGCRIRRTSRASTSATRSNLTYTQAALIEVNPAK